MTTPKRHTRDKPDKPYARFPLFAHAGGTWCKKIGGKQRHFGPWSEPAKALERFNDFMAVARLGVKPRRKASAASVEHIVNAYMTYQNGKVARKALSLRSFKDCEQVTTKFAERIGDRVAALLGPGEFADYAASISHLGVYAFNRHVTILRGMFKWAFNSGLLETAVRYGPAFSVRPESAKRREQFEREKKFGKRLFTADEIHALLDCASLPMRAMILLGVNCGFGNTDVARLEKGHIDFEDLLIDFRRVKTGIARRCPIWPETAAAIMEWLKRRPREKNPADKDLVFLTTFGVPFVREQSELIDGVYQRPVIVDSVGLVFTKLAKSLDIKGRTFYALRATFRTWADETGKDRATDHIMGHTISGAKRAYIRDIPVEDLRAVSDHVRAKLFRSRSRRARQKSTTRSKGRSGKRSGAPTR